MFSVPYAECRQAECHYAEWRCAEWSCSECHYAEWRCAEYLYDEWRCAECHYAEWRCADAECRGAHLSPSLKTNLFPFQVINKCSSCSFNGKE